MTQDPTGKKNRVEKHKMEAILKDWGDTAVQERYKRDRHSALGDAWCLASLCFSQPDFLEWIEDPPIVTAGHTGAYSGFPFPK